MSMDDIQFDWVPDYSNDMLIATVTRQLQIAEQKHWLGLLANAWDEGAVAGWPLNEAVSYTWLENNNPYRAMLRSLDG
jgi:hypothetical protein